MPYDNTDEEDLSRLNQLREQIFNWFVPLRTVWEKPDTTAVSYTHLDVYKRQFWKFIKHWKAGNRFAGLHIECNEIDWIKIICKKNEIACHRR